MRTRHSSEPERSDFIGIMVIPAGLEPATLSLGIYWSIESIRKERLKTICC